MRATLPSLLLLGSAALSTAAPTVTISIPSTEAISTLNPTYASWNIDPSCNRGFHVTDFSNANLIAGASGLYPSMLRFSGSGADALVYSLSEGQPECAAIDPTVCASDPGYTTPGCLNASHWERLHTLATASQSQFIFGVSFDLPAACAAAGPSYVWNSSNVERFLAYLSAHGQTLYGMELGNEPNNNGGPPCNLAPSSQAAAFAALGRLVAPLGLRLIGPDTGYRYPQTWLEALLPLLPAPLHAITHHVYNGLSRADYNSPAQLNSALPEMQWYMATVQRLGRGAQAWAGEDGPIGGGNDGTCGKSSVCGTYASSLWYADDMALRAAHGFSQYQRQDLFGGAYGLLRSQTGAMALRADEPVVIAPDFWVSFLWKRCLGAQVLNASSSSAQVRAYAFSGAPASNFPAPACTSVQLLLINLSNATSTPVALPGVAGAGARYAAYALTPVAGDAFAGLALLNGQALPGAIDAQRVDPGTFLKGIVQAPVQGAVADGVTLAPLSINFLCYSA